MFRHCIIGDIDGEWEKGLLFNTETKVWLFWEDHISGYGNSGTIWQLFPEDADMLLAGASDGVFEECDMWYMFAQLCYQFGIYDLGDEDEIRLYRKLFNNPVFLEEGELEEITASAWSGGKPGVGKCDMDKFVEAFYKAWEAEQKKA